ncbi:MAG: mechanosensitive ion channel [Nitrospirae bacterium]|nr:mechanosensitive ion channel [Nitrospirota bacterium]
MDFSWLHAPDSTTIQYGITTLILVISFICLRLVLVRLILKSPGIAAETRRRWVVTIRNVLVGIFIIGLLSIWESQLSAFAVSLVAVALAVVLATKELIACMNGATLRMVTNAYALGDRIAIGTVRGNVVNYNLLTTTVLEVGPGQTSHQYTGRAMVFPNSLLLTQPLTNETYTKKYIIHVITIPLSKDDNWELVEQILLDAAYKECSPYIDEARTHMKNLEGKHWLDAPSVEPRVHLQIPEPGKINLLLRVPSPAHRPSRTEQAILRHFLREYTPSMCV